MPLYFFKCKCGHSFERLRRMGKGGLSSRCPGCRRRRAPRDLKAEGGKTMPPFTPYYSKSLGVMHKDEKLHGESYNSNLDLMIESRDAEARHHNRLGFTPAR